MKKSSRRRGSHRSSSAKGFSRVVHDSSSEMRIERALIENFIALQKVMANLSTRFDNLSGQISKLLELFEISAKSLAKKDFDEMDRGNKSEREVMEKLESLEQQAGLIGKGLALMHESNSERYPERPPSMSIPSMPMRQMSQIEKPMLPSSSQDYQKSMLRASESSE